MDYEGTYQYAKSENFMQGKPRFKRNKKISDCIQTSQKEGVVMKEKKLRIRKLTEGECIRLMGFEKKDTKAMREAGISKSIIYHSAGDSIVTTCLVGIFGQLLGKPHKEITEAYSDRLSEEE